MSYGVSCEAEVYISRRHYEHLCDLENDIDEERDTLNRLWDQVLAYMVATPTDYRDEDGNVIAAPDFVLQRYRELREEIDEQTILLSNLETLKENFDKRVNE